MHGVIRIPEVPQMLHHWQRPVGNRTRCAGTATSCRGSVAASDPGRLAERQDPRAPANHRQGRTPRLFQVSRMIAAEAALNLEAGTKSTRLVELPIEK